jgi:hypothetical protein
MGDPVTIAFVTFAAVSAVSSIAGGMTANKAARAEASLLDEQGRIAQQEAAAEAQRVANENRRFMKRQKLAFLKNGVSLEGSPLFEQERVLRESQEEVNAEVRRGNAQAELFSRRAQITRNEGRASMIGGITQGVGAVFNAFGTGRAGGLF